MQCLILAGGLGTRMQKISNTPKALLPIGSQTFIDWQLQWLKILGINQVVMAIGHGGELIEEHIRTKSTLIPEVHFSHDGPTLLGTGGAIRHAANYLKDDFFVAYGDSFLFVNMHKLMSTHLKEHQPLTFSIMKNKNQGDTSNVSYQDGNLFYDKFNVTADMDYIDYGMSVLNKEYFLKKAPEGKFDLAQFINQACLDKKITPFVINEPFYEIGSPQGYETFKNFMEKTSLRSLATEKGLLS
jgi:MurNAc alpha-1-phosphate uridylyltransferase